MNKPKKQTINKKLLFILGFFTIIFFIILIIVKKGCSREFTEPIDVNWEGVVIAHFNSGVNYGIKKIPDDNKNPYFYAGFTKEEFDKVWSEHNDVGLEGNVRVRGKWVGITDAYKNTVFEGKCVPDVEIITIEKY